MEAQQLNAEPAVMRATVHITRKATGLTETYEVVGTVPPNTIPAELVQPEPKED